MHFLQKITRKAAMDQKVCIIFFVTVSMMVLQGSKDSKYGISHMKLGQFLTFVGEMMRAT